MDTVFEINRWFHMIVGFVGLAAWWIPLTTKKGGARHVLFGKVFAASAYVIGTTALIGALGRLGWALWRGADPAANVETFGFLIFLAYLGVLALTITHYAVRTIRTRRDRAAIRTRFMLGITWLMMVGSGIVAGYALLRWSGVSIVLLALSPIGVLAGSGMLRYMNGRKTEKMAWWYEHMGAMLGAGIAYHTAFLVFGSRVVLDLSILGPFNWVPWVAPAIIGTVGGRYWESYYRRKFGDLPASGDEAQASA